MLVLFIYLKRKIGLLLVCFAMCESSLCLSRTWDKSYNWQVTVKNFEDEHLIWWHYLLMCISFVCVHSILRTASAVFHLAHSLNWMAVHSVNSITINAEGPSAMAADSPLLAAASVPWGTSFILSTLCVLSAWHSCQKASSESRTTRPTVNSASLSSFHSSSLWSTIYFMLPETRAGKSTLCFPDLHSVG